MGSLLAELNINDKPLVDSVIANTYVPTRRNPEANCSVLGEHINME